MVGVQAETEAEAPATKNSKCSLLRRAHWWHPPWRRSLMVGAMRGKQRVINLWGTVTRWSQLGYTQSETLHLVVFSYFACHVSLVQHRPAHLFLQCTFQYIHSACYNISDFNPLYVNAFLLFIPFKFPPTWSGSEDVL